MATKLRAAIGAKVTAKTLTAKDAVRDGKSGAFEEVFVRNDAVSLCLLLNRRARTMRVIDFRAGASPAKKVFVQSIARREQVDKVIVLVERDECSTWARLGFAREGNIPGFYKRSDAFIMGCVVPAADAPTTRSHPATRAVPAPVRPNRIGESGVFSISTYGFEPQLEDDDDDELPAPVASAVAEKTMVHARRLAKDIVLSAALKLSPLSAVDLQKRTDKAAKDGRALTGFEPFGRDVLRDDVLVSQRGLEIVVGAEIQRCYGNAFLEVLASPKDDKERNFLAAALHAACERLHAAHSVCAFALCPVDDVRMATSFVAAGFRRTGLLRQHLRLRDQRVDALLFCRKLAVPGDEA